MRTDYRGPTKVDQIEVAGRVVQLVRPSEPDRLLDAPDVLAYNKADDYMPYWAYLWPGAYLLAEAVARENVRAGTKTLEIGCGLGLTGLVAALAGAEVRFTDYDDAPLAFVAASAEANGIAVGSYSVARFDWREPAGEPFDLILGADVLYERRLVPLVADVLEARLTATGMGLVSNPYRVAAEDFPGELAKRGLACESVAIASDSKEFGSVKGLLYRVKRGST